MVKLITFIQCTTCVLIFSIHFSVFAQQNSLSIQGQILDKKTKEPLIGASVLIVNDKTGTVSDTEGKFALSPKSFPATISVSYLGYQTSKISVGENSGTITVFLLEDASLLNEIVVVGYGTQRRKELTGAISTVSKAQLEYNVSPTVDGLLSGAVAGVAVTQSSGQPGAPASIRIRGGNSINASNDPLYVIDGFIFFSDNSSTKTGLGAIEGESNPLNLLNPSDIESIEILKDVSATAIYGSRGSNGVIMITTKKGRKGDSSVNYQYSAGWSKSAKTLNLLNASQWARIQRDYFLNKGKYSDAEIDQLGAGYDWQNAVLRTGIEQTHSISISGGDEKSRYFLSGNYLTQDGIILNSGFNRFVGRINYDREVFSNLSIGINLTANKSTQNSLTTFEDVNYNDSPYSHGIANSLTYALYMPPVVPIYNKDGGYNYNNPYEYAYLREGDTTANPVSDLMNSSSQTINTVLLGSFYAKYTIVEGLTAKINLGTNISHTTQNYFAPSYTAVGLAPDGIGGVGNKRQEVFLSEYTLNYIKTWSKTHAIDALAGFTYEDTQTNFQTIQTAKFINETLGVNNLQDGEEPYPPVTGAGNGKLYSLLGRLNYSLLERYHLTANFRSDYSTRFAKNHKWGFFPSVGLSWNINEEKFLKDFTALNNLKLRL
ncbi:MAG: TonB-dependent receptor SusC, partial [Candidatus Ordinivivax streblomastigis]